MSSLRGLISFPMRHLMHRFLLLTLTLTALAARAEENEPSKANEPRRWPRESMKLLGQKLKQLGWQPASRCDDASFLRRATLDLAGTVPTGREVLDFISNPSATKRNDLVKRLLASPPSSAHLANTWSKLVTARSEQPRSSIWPARVCRLGFAVALQRTSVMIA